MLGLKLNHVSKSGHWCETIAWSYIWYIWWQVFVSLADPRQRGTGTTVTEFRPCDFEISYVYNKSMYILMPSLLPVEWE